MRSRDVCAARYPTTAPTPAQSRNPIPVSFDGWETHKGAGQALDQDEDLQRYSIIDGFTRASMATNTMLHLSIAGRWTSATALYDEVRRRWEGQEPAFTRELSNRERGSYGEPLGFLGALQRSLRTVVADVAAGEDPRKNHRYQPMCTTDACFDSSCVLLAATQAEPSVTGRAGGSATQRHCDGSSIEYWMIGAVNSSVSSCGLSSTPVGLGIRSPGRWSPCLRVKAARVLEAVRVGGSGAAQFSKPSASAAAEPHSPPGLINVTLDRLSNFRS